MPGQHRIDQLGDNGLIIAYDTRKNRVTTAQFSDQVPPHLVTDPSGPVSRRTEVSNCGGVLGGFRHGVTIVTGGVAQYLRGDGHNETGDYGSSAQVGAGSPQRHGVRPSAGFRRHSLGYGEEFQ